MPLTLLFADERLWHMAADEGPLESLKGIRNALLTGFLAHEQRGNHPLLLSSASQTRMVFAKGMGNEASTSRIKAISWTLTVLKDLFQGSCAFQISHLAP